MKLSSLFALDITLFIMSSQCYRRLNYSNTIEIGFRCNQTVTSYLSSLVADTSKLCQLQQMWVNLHKVDDAAYFPTLINIQTCAGTCFDLGSSLRFQMIKSVIKSQEACCIPTAYKDLSVYSYLNKSTNQVRTKIYKNAIATHCGCRF